MLFIATSYHARECFNCVVYSVLHLYEIDAILLCDQYTKNVYWSNSKMTPISYDYITEYMTKFLLLDKESYKEN